MIEFLSLPSLISCLNKCLHMSLSLFFYHIRTNLTVSSVSFFFLSRSMALADRNINFIAIKRRKRSTIERGHPYTHTHARTQGLLNARARTHTNITLTPLGHRSPRPSSPPIALDSVCPRKERDFYGWGSGFPCILVRLFLNLFDLAGEQSRQ